jgi:hypothetical protein
MKAFFRERRMPLHAANKYSLRFVFGVKRVA